MMENIFIIRFLFSVVVYPCHIYPCENNGTCRVDVNDNATCICEGNWNGPYCQGMYIVYYRNSARKCFMFPVPCESNGGLMGVHGFFVITCSKFSPIS